MSNGNQTTVVEIVSYQTKEGISAAKAQEAALGVNTFIQRQPGFLRRIYTQTSENSYVDIVLWSDLRAAQQANEKAMQLPEAATFFATIDESTMQFHHASIIFDSASKK